MSVLVPLVLGFAVGFVIGYFRATRKFPWN